MYTKYLEILQNNDINNFYHFTNLSNLESILKHGIMNVLDMKQNNIPFICSDPNRHDEQLNCISLSLSTSNKTMLYNKKNHSNSEWIVLELNAEEIIKNHFNNMYFCKYNASSPSVISILKNNKDFLKSPTALKNMINNSKELSYQAEILLEGNIDIRNITCIYAEDLQTKLIIEQLLLSANIDSINVIIKKEMF